MQPEKQTFLQRLKDLVTLTGRQTYTRKEPTREELIQSEFSKFSPELQKMLSAMAYKESLNGAKRINVNDQNIAGVGSSDLNSYGLLHMGQSAVDTFNKRPAGQLEFIERNLKAKDLMGPESDLTQKVIQGTRISNYMKKYGKDLFYSTRYIQNAGEPNYATSTMSNYDKYLSNASTTASQAGR
jgi:hypothetical protein